MTLNSSIITINGIGEKTATVYNKIGIYTVNDLLSHYPRDYEEWNEIVPISELKANQVQAIKAMVVSTPKTVHIRRNMSITTVHVKDNSGAIKLTYFNMPYMKNSFQLGSVYIFRGRVAARKTELIIEHPKIISQNEYEQMVNSMLPIYSTTKGLTVGTLSKSIKNALESLAFKEDYLPKDIISKYKLVSYKEAMYGIHFPKNKEELINARKRLVFEEFLFFIISVMALKDFNIRDTNDAPMMKIDACDDFINQLPYDLTGAQKKVWKEIENDLNSNRLMNRLVQGDVGSGKTIVAVLAIFMCIMNHKQAAFMAPTEVLAKQHYESIVDMSNKYNLPFIPVLLTGSLTAKEKRIAKEKIINGECNVIVGTSALIQEDVSYYDLKLVITDEQHRFGVRQRESLAQKGIKPHILVMSATPIPRTLALILYGDLDISVMDEMPANRLPIKNCVVNTDYRKKAYEFIANQVKEGRQAYVICPMVESDENSEITSDLENVIDYTKKLKDALPGVRIEYLHGQMKPKDKNRIMEEYANHNIDVLVSTTVIEVGINVPNSTVMMVENSERFGLAQLHQLRGRVGRGVHQSYCIFISSSTQESTMQRLNVLNKSNDGFFISSEDMRLRGPGDLFGIRQSGQFQFQLGDIYQDASILQNAGECAKLFFNDYNERKNPEFNRFWKYYDDNIHSSVDFINI